MDLAEAVEFDLRAARKNIQAVRPGMRTLELSVKSGVGVDAYMKFLQDFRIEQDLHVNLDNHVNRVRRV
jgi:Ni2+-binding GTPase involved in maturation of urease and hydrogenase